MRSTPPSSVAERATVTGPLFHAASHSAPSQVAATVGSLVSMVTVTELTASSLPSTS